MALIDCKFYSKILDKETSAKIILPISSSVDTNKYDKNAGTKSNIKFKTLVLLHGWSGSDSDWVRYTQAELYATNHNLAIVCPDGDNSHYVDWVVGPQYQTFLQKEFLPLMRMMFPLSDKREDSFVGGLSMGGYGACLWALTYPETFSCICSFSGGVDIVPRLQHYVSGGFGNGQKSPAVQMKNVYGDLEKAKEGKYNIYDLIESYPVDLWKTTSVFASCGEQDKIAWNPNKKLLEKVEEHGGKTKWFSQDGIHDFYFWDAALKEAIFNFLPLD